MTNSQGSGMKSEINVTPLVDVVLVLLVIFIVVTPMLVSQGVNLPQASYGDPHQDPSSKTISLTASGLLYFEQEPMTEEILVQRLKDLQERNPGARVILRADRTVEYGAVHHVLDLASGAGLHNLALQAQPVAAP